MHQAYDKVLKASALIGRITNVSDCLKARPSEHAYGERRAQISHSASKIKSF